MIVLHTNEVIFGLILLLSKVLNYSSYYVLITVTLPLFKVGFETTYTPQCQPMRLSETTYMKWNQVFIWDNGINASIKI